MEKHNYIIAKLQQLRGMNMDVMAGNEYGQACEEIIDILDSLPESDNMFMINLLKKVYCGENVTIETIKVCAPICGVLLFRKERRAVPLIGRIILEPYADFLREDMVLFIGEVGDPAAVPFLIKALSDKELWVRAKAAESLGTLGDRGAVPHLIALLNDESETVIEYALRALLDLKAKEASFAIINVLKNDDPPYDEYPYIRLVAAEVLGRLGIKEAVPFLQKIVENETSEEFIGKARKAIEKLL